MNEKVFFNLNLASKIIPSPSYQMMQPVAGIPVGFFRELISFLIQKSIYLAIDWYCTTTSTHFSHIRFINNDNIIYT